MKRPQSAVAAARSASGAVARPSTASDAGSLRRRIKQLEANHRDWQEQSQKDLRRQKAEIDSLRRDNEPLKQQVNELRAVEATSGSVNAGSPRGPKSRGLRCHRELEAKRDVLSDLQRKVRDQHQRVADVEALIDNVRSQLRLQRKTRGGVNVTKESHEAINKQVTVLENRLDQSLQRFNDVLRQNKELRDQIDTLRGEREVFDEIYLKLEADLQDKKKEMAFIIEVSNIAYEERDNNVQVLSNLKTFAAEEMNSFEETFKELDELLEEDRKMKEQVKARLALLEKKERSFGDDAQRSRGGASSSTKQPATLDAEAINQEDNAVTQARQYEHAFEQIRQRTPIDDLDAIVEQFLKAEEANYSLFSYVNDLGREIETLEKQRTRHLDEIDEITVGNTQDKSRREALKELEDKLRVEESKAQSFSDMSVRTESVLRSIMTIVEQMFARLDCDERPIIAAHGVSGLTVETVLLYMAGIEIRTDEYLTAWCRMNGMLETAGPHRFLGHHDQPPPDRPTRLPATGEESDGDNDDTRPLSHEELLRKAQKKLESHAKETNAPRTNRFAANGHLIRK